MKLENDDIYDLSSHVGAQVIDDVLKSIALRLKAVMQEEKIDNVIIIKVYGQVILWLTMDYVDRAIDDRFFDKKIEFIQELCRMSITVLRFREQERNKKFDS
jgi:hypothetical protein